MRMYNINYSQQTPYVYGIYTFTLLADFINNHFLIWERSDSSI